jgi:translation initiation factor 3 subunit M
MCIPSRSTHRVFTDKHWGQLADKIADWKSNLKEVLQVLSNAKLIAESQQVTSITEPPVPTSSQ